MKLQTLILGLFFSLFLFSCGTQKKIVKASGDVVEQSVQDFWTNYTSQIPKLEAVQIKSRVNANIDGKNINATLRLYIENQKMVWLNASMLGFTGARGLITPNSVKAYEVLDRTYVDTDFSYLNNTFKVDFFNLGKLQQILLGQLPLLSTLNNYSIHTNNENGEYVLSYKNNERLSNTNQQGEYIHTYFLDSAYRLRKIEITEPKEKTQITVTYDDWVRLEDNNLPSVVKIMIKAKEPSFIELDYNNFTFESTNPPFKIPNGYSERKVK